jgi:hypothetical protein
MAGSLPFPKQVSCVRPGVEAATVNHDNRVQVQTCELVNPVSGRLAEYANDLISFGVDELRLDAAKRTHTVHGVRTKCAQTDRSIRYCH